MNVAFKLQAVFCCFSSSTKVVLVVIVLAVVVVLVDSVAFLHCVDFTMPRLREGSDTQLVLHGMDFIGSIVGCHPAQDSLHSGNSVGVPLLAITVAGR